MTDVTIVADNNAATSITPDGQRMLVLNVYNSNGTMEKGISISQFNGTTWDFPQKVIIDSFYNDNIYDLFVIPEQVKSPLPLIDAILFVLV